MSTFNKILFYLGILIALSFAFLAGLRIDGDSWTRRLSEDIRLRFDPWITKPGSSYPNSPSNPYDESYSDVIGVELGSEYSRVSVFKGNELFVLPAGEDGKTTPSCVAYTEEGVLIGNPAVEYGVLRSENTICNPRKLLGRDFRNPDFQNDISGLPYKVTHIDNKPVIRMKVNRSSKILHPEEITAALLMQLKSTAEEFLDRKVFAAVVTCPFSFTQAQKQAIKDAGTIAGLSILRLVNEPTSASIGNKIDALDGEKLILTYDITSSDYTVTLSEHDIGVFEVLSSASGFFNVNSQPKHTLEKYFRNLTASILANATTTPLKLEDIDHVVLTGTPANTALLLPFLSSSFAMEKIRNEIPFDESVVRGAGFQGRIFSNEYETDEGFYLMDVTPLSLGIETAGGIFHKVLSRNTVIPNRRSVMVAPVTEGDRKVVVRVFEGERGMVKGNELLGEMVVDLEDGERSVEVGFEIGVNSDLQVWTKRVGDEEKMEMVVVNGFDQTYHPSRVDAAIEDAEAHHSEDDIAAFLAHEDILSKDSRVASGLKIVPTK